MATQLPPGSYYGQTLRSRKIASFDLSERIYSPGYQTPKHTHKQALFCFVIDGGYSETYGRRTRECSSPTLLFHPPEELHAERFHESGGRSFIIEVGPSWVSLIRDQLAISENSSDFHGTQFELLGCRLYREFYNDDCASAIIIEGLMVQLFGETARFSADKLPGQSSPRWLERARDLLHAHFAESLTLAEIAQDVGVHPVHLAQTFHKTYHSTVGDYVRKLRIEYACRELATSARPIVDIALAAGFCDQSHFTRTFKRCIGTAPSQFRESQRAS